jgi:hypothetical protein
MVGFGAIPYVLWELYLVFSADFHYLKYELTQKHVIIVAFVLPNAKPPASTTLSKRLTTVVASIASIVWMIAGSMHLASLCL